MFKIIALLFLMLSAGQTYADTCPDFYRFVDFGKKTHDGETYRGGPTFRAEGFDGANLLLTERSICREIREISRDGRGNPIPIVTRIYYNPELTGIAVTELYLASVESTLAEGEKNTSAHHARLSQTETIETRGPNFLCAEAADTDEISCQIVSPYPGNIALVVYCDTRQCEMPVMAINERLMVGATWRRPESTRNKSEQTGAHIMKVAQEIHDLLATLS